MIKTVLKLFWSHVTFNMEVDMDETVMTVLENIFADRQVVL